MNSFVLRGCEVEGRIVDVRIRGARVTDVGDVRCGPDEEAIDALGGALLPGLHDAHLHLLALAAAARSLSCGPPVVIDRAGLPAALAGAPADARGWVRGVGYVETVAGDLDAATLDRLHRDRPVRVQHRSGALWAVNSKGIDRLGLDRTDHPGVERSADGSATGLWRADTWLRTRLPATDLPDLETVGRRLAGFGITSVCDATPDLDHSALASLAKASARGALPTRLQVLGAPLQFGALPAPLTTGPYKIVLADSGLPDIDQLADRIRAAHSADRAVAVHCVTRQALVLLLATFHLTGCGPAIGSSPRRSSRPTSSPVVPDSACTSSPSRASSSIAVTTTSATWRRTTCPTCTGAAASWMPASWSACPAMPRTDRSTRGRS